jgi:hypothetical protein
MQKQTLTLKADTPRKLTEEQVEYLRTEAARWFVGKIAEVTHEPVADTLDDSTAKWKQETK